MMIITAEKNVSIKKCIQEEVLSFSQLTSRGITDELTLIEWIANYIYIFFSVYFNVSNNINPSQSIMIANEFVKRSDLSPEDVICFIKSIKENEGNKYGSTFNRIDPSVISEWLMIYLDFRIDAKEIYELERKSQYSVPGERTNNTYGLSEIPVFNKKTKKLEYKKL
jgi:hypothetical protein